MIRHVVVYRDGRALLDRQTLAYLSKRSIHTIRAKCPIVGHQDGKALYDMEYCLGLLADIPARPHARLLDLA